VVIGRPLANAQVYVIDGSGQEAGIGRGGELYVGGAGLGTGYWRRAEQTAERYVPDWVSGEAGARLYRTGDEVRWEESGELSYEGRQDGQVKVRGYRIELGEVEAVIGRHAGVRQCVVRMRKEGRGEAVMVAYVVKEGEKRGEGVKWREYLSEVLPEYMIPAVYVEMEELPVTANGKLDFKALAKYEASLSQPKSEYIAPQTSIEKVIAKVWQEALGLEKVGIHDNFFDLGGHSLLLVQVHQKLQELLDCELAVIDLFEYPTISSLAEHLSSQHGGPLDFQQSIARAESRRARTGARSRSAQF